MTTDKRRRDGIVDAGSDVAVAPCDTCAFAYRRCTREREVCHVGSPHLACVWHVAGVPIDILTHEKECSRYAKRTTHDT